MEVSKRQVFFDRAIMYEAPVKGAGDKNEEAEEEELSEEADNDEDLAEAY